MLDLAPFYVVLAWLAATVVLIVDVRSLRDELARERAERLATEQQRKLSELTLARFAHERHQEVIGILRANIVPDRVPPAEQDDNARQGEDPPTTQREPAVARSQRPPAPPLSFPEPPPASADIWGTKRPGEQGAA